MNDERKIVTFRLPAELLARVDAAVAATETEWWKRTSRSRFIRDSIEAALKRKGL